MSPLARTAGLAGLTAGAGFFVLLGAPGVSNSPPLVLTTDLPRYCLQLSDRVDELMHVAPGPLSDEVVSLTTEGRVLCDKGRVRGGVMRLRRAVLLMTNDVARREGHEPVHPGP